MFTILILEMPQIVEADLLNPDAEVNAKPIERLRVNVTKITERQMRQISRIAWKIPRKVRKDKGLSRPRKVRGGEEML